jgi:hypothetical protein
VRLGQVLAVGSFALEQVRHGICPETIDAHIQPEAGDIVHFLLNLGLS